MIEGMTSRSLCDIFETLIKLIRIRTASLQTENESTTIFKFKSMKKCYNIHWNVKYK